MHIDEALLSKLEKLSMIHIEEGKRVAVSAQLSEILGFVENIASIDVPTNCFKQELKTPLRADEVSNSGISSDVLSHAPKVESNYFIVPKIIE